MMPRLWSRVRDQGESDDRQLVAAGGVFVDGEHLSDAASPAQPRRGAHALPRMPAEGNRQPSPRAAAPAPDFDHDGRPPATGTALPEPTARRSPRNEDDGTQSRRLGELLVSEGLVRADQLERALAEQADSGLRIGELLVRAGVLDERRLTVVLSRKFGVAVVDLSRQSPDADVAQRLDEQVARELTVVPLRSDGPVVEIVAGDLRPDLEERLSRELGCPVRLVSAPPGDVRQVIDRVYRSLSEVDRMVSAYIATEGARASATAVTTGSTAADSSPVAKIVGVLVTEALRDRASDVHIEPSDSELVIRFRIDGALHDVLKLSKTVAGPLVSRIKILAGMNIVERRKAQDGQFATKVDGREIDVRVSTMATVAGEKCVLRILDRSRSMHRLGQLGMPEDTKERYDKTVRSPFGMVLCAGPTGSGKTTTLYATLNAINERSRNVMTIEDPVEYVFPTINQIQTNEQAGISFAEGLRAVLRQDPDVILVGEIRDIDTARTAVQAALTGHFVLSSLHATDSVAALHRFLDMGIEAFLVASSVLGVVSQRLVRRICRSCMTPYVPTETELAFFRESGGSAGVRLFHGTGCNICSGTGYRERIGVYEYLEMTPEIRRLLVGWATQEELRRVAVNQGTRTLRSEGIALVEQGITTISEVVKTIYGL